MGEALRRNAGRVCLLLAAIFAVVAFVSPYAGAAGDIGQDIPPPEVFSGDASTRAITVSVAQQYPLVPVDELFTFVALEGKSTFSTSTQSARASLFFPGQGGILGPSLACGSFGGQFPAEFKPILDTCLQYSYPLSVNADAFQPDAASTGSLVLGAPTDAISGEAITARAHAAADGASSDAAMNALRVIGVPPFGPLSLPVPQLQLDGSVASADSVSARTDQRIVAGALVTRATATISGLKLVGGIVRIGNIVSVSETRDDGKGGRSATADLDATGVTVAGQPAKITNKGIVVDDPKNPTPLNRALFDQANAVVKQFGIKVTALATEEILEGDGPATASVGGVLVEFTREVTGLPLVPSPIAPDQQIELNGRYNVSVQLAQTGAKSTAANFGLDGGGDDPGFSDDFTGGGDESFDGGGDFSGDSGDFGLGGGAIGDGDTAVGGGAGVGRDDSGNGGGGRAPRAIASTANDFGDRAGFLYLALMFAVLGLCIAPRLALPARLPGPRA